MSAKKNPQSAKITTKAELEPQKAKKTTKTELEVVKEDASASGNKTVQDEIDVMVGQLKLGS